METQQIVDFIRRQLWEGKKRDEIERVLRLNHIGQHEINIAWNAAEWQNKHGYGGLWHGVWRGVALIFNSLLVIAFLAASATVYLEIARPEWLAIAVGYLPSYLQFDVTLPNLSFFTNWLMTHLPFKLFN